MEKFPEFFANHIFLFTLLFAISAMLLWSIVVDTTGARSASSDEATRLINHENAMIADLRPHEAFGNNHILNAINVATDALPKALEKYQKQTIIVYCGNGHESARFARNLKRSGFENIYYLKGGITEWQQAGLPIVKGKT